MSKICRAENAREGWSLRPSKISEFANFKVTLSFFQIAISYVSLLLSSNFDLLFLFLHKKILRQFHMKSWFIYKEHKIEFSATAACNCMIDTVKLKKDPAKFEFT